MALSHFPQFVQNALSHRHSDGKQYGVNESSKRHIRNLELLNGELHAASGGKFYITKVRSTKASGRRQNRLGEVSVVINGKPFKYPYDLNDNIVFAGFEGALKKAGIAEYEAKRIASEIKEAILNIESTHSILFTQRNEQKSDLVTQSPFKAWIEIHDPEKKSVVGEGSLAEARFVQDIESADVKLLKVIGGKNGLVNKGDVESEKVILKKLGKWYGELFRSSNTTKKSTGAGQRESKYYLITDYDGLELAANFLKNPEDKAKKLYKGEQNASKQLQAFCGIAKLAVEAMAQVHAKGILHRDIKPANMTMTPDEKIRLIDYGAAVKVQSSDLKFDVSGLAGTPGYADEAIQAGLFGGHSVQYGKHTEIYSMGLSLAEMMPPESCILNPKPGLKVGYPIQVSPEFMKKLSSAEAKEDYDQLIKLLNSCGASDISLRPTSETLISAFEAFGKKFESRVVQVKSGLIGGVADSNMEAGSSQRLLAEPVNGSALDSKMRTAIDGIDAAFTTFKTDRTSYFLKENPNATQIDRRQKLMAIGRAVDELINTIKDPKIDNMVKLQAINEACEQIEGLRVSARGNTFHSASKLFNPMVSELIGQLRVIERSFNVELSEGRGAYRASSSPQDGKKAETGSKFKNGGRR